jgi:hypothetical protein
VYRSEEPDDSMAGEFIKIRVEQMEVKGSGFEKHPRFFKREEGTRIEHSSSE